MSDGCGSDGSSGSCRVQGISGGSGAMFVGSYADPSGSVCSCQKVLFGHKAGGCLHADVWLVGLSVVSECHSGAWVSLHPCFCAASVPQDLPIASAQSHHAVMMHRCWHASPMLWAVSNLCRFARAHSVHLLCDACCVGRAFVLKDRKGVGLFAGITARRCLVVSLLLGRAQVHLICPRCWRCCILCCTCNDGELCACMPVCPWQPSSV